MPHCALCYLGLLYIHSADVLLVLQMAAGVVTGTAHILCAEKRVSVLRVQWPGGFRAALLQQLGL